MAFRLPASVQELAQTVTQAVTGRGRDRRFFHSSKKGEIHELKEELHSANKEKKKEAVKKVIAAMTIGKDVSGLFPDVVNCMQTANIELKKLVYLYVINYAKVQPELAILAINTFRKDSLDTNPLVRALAVRTMGCIRLEQVVEYLVEPLRKACKDPDPYVRKTAATCICKLYDTSPETVEDQGFLDLLQEMLSDNNPSVIANAVASLAEISQTSRKDYLNLNEETVSKLLTALSECSEWGQVFILDALATYEPPNAAVAASVLERTTARLSHANAAVVLSTARLILRMLDLIDDPQVVRATHKKLGPPLVTLLSAESEIQYVALRNISLIVQKYPEILGSEVKMFFCKYNDPHYVKMEKLQILIRLTTEKNVDQVLMELKEYATEVDVEFVKRTIRAIGRCAIKLDKAAEKCIAVLLSLIDTRVNYVVQETIVVIKDIFRKYPNRYEGVISRLCENLDSLDDPEANASMIWIIGEYAERIDNADELLETFLDGFHDEAVIVRQQLLTATVKLFLKCPSRAQNLVTRVLKLATEEGDDPDLRDRGFIYWRLLSTNPEATKKVVLSDKPMITDVSFSLDTGTLDRLLDNISTLASVFHRVPESFITRLRGQVGSASHSPSESDNEDEEGHANPREIQEKMKKQQSADGDAYASESSSGDEDGSHPSSGPSDLLDLKEAEDSSSSEEESSEAGIAEWPLLLSPDTPGTSGQKGIGIKGMVHKFKGRIYLKIAVVNTSQIAVIGSSWAVQINKNSFGLAPVTPASLGFPDLEPGQTAQYSILLNPNVNLSHTAPAHPLTLQVAAKTSVDVFYLQPLPFSIAAAIADRDPVDMEVFRSHWTRMGEAKQESFMGLFHEDMTTDQVVSRLAKRGIKLVVRRGQETFDSLYLSAVTTNNLLLLLEIAVQKSGRGVKITIRSDAPQMFAILKEFSIDVLKIQPRC